MNTSNISTLKGSVNVTVHKNYLKNDNSTYAKVQRNTAGMHNVIAVIRNKSQLFDEASLVASSMLFKDAILELLKQGISINLFEIGTLYPSVQGNIENPNPDTTEIPELTLGFSPSQEALEAVGKAEVAMTQLEESLPVINIIEDLSTHKTDCSITPGMPLRIKGRRLKIAGDSDSVGLFFAPNDENGDFNKTEADWIKIDESSFFKNTSSFLELILSNSLISGKNYTLIIKTAAGRGSVINKTIRTFVYDKPITIT
ncbi:MAG: DUF4469 domain-containing protein [Treponema bryantii]|nr:DUF4469 domain-containing protein [Treponema bryantii]